MKHLAFTLIATIALFGNVGLYGQTTAQTNSESYEKANGLTQEQIESLQGQIKQKVDIFQNELSIIVNASNSEKTKNTAINDALNLFIGEGNPYYYIDPMTDQRVQHKAVTMQTTGRGGRIATQTMKYYLNATKYSATHAKITIEQAEGVQVSEIYAANSEGTEYVATATYFQTYRRETDWSVRVDQDIKKVKVYIQKRAVITPAGAIEVFVIKLGDVKSVDSSNFY